LLVEFSIFSVLSLCFLATVMVNKDEYNTIGRFGLKHYSAFEWCSLTRRGNSKLKEHCEADTCEPHATACVVVPWESRVM